MPYRTAARAGRRLHAHASALPGGMQALLWAAASGMLFALLNALMRRLTLELPPMQVQFLRYLCGVLVLMPLVWRAGLAAYKPRNPAGQLWRGVVHTVGLVLWFLALPHIPLADTTAIGFTAPIFIMIGAWWFLREPMRWERWLATAVGFTGVLIVLGPKLGLSGAGLQGGYHLMMLASAPVFAASFLITKVLTRTESAGVIVLWQGLTVTLFSVPLALWSWQSPNALQWLILVFCGMLGSGGHYCLTRSFGLADISATQSLKFLDLVWAAALGWLLFADVPAQTTLLGGVVICAATVWVARREHRLARDQRDRQRLADSALTEGPGTRI